MNITAFDVYLVMQLDSILTVVWFFLISTLVTTVVSFFILCNLMDDCSSGGEELKSVKSFVKRSVVALVAVSVVIAVVPSSKTAATMLVLPAVANNETISKEAGELYDIAKSALKELVADKSKKE